MAVLNPPRTMFEVFEALPEGTLCQLINNQLVMSPAPSDTHQDITGEIFSQLLAHVKSNRLGKIGLVPMMFTSIKKMFFNQILFLLLMKTHIA